MLLASQSIPKYFYRFHQNMLNYFVYLFRVGTKRKLLNLDAALDPVLDSLQGPYLDLHLDPQFCLQENKGSWLKLLNLERYTKSILIREQKVKKCDGPAELLPPMASKEW